MHSTDRSEPVDEYPEHYDSNKRLICTKAQGSLPDSLPTVPYTLHTHTLVILSGNLEKPRVVQTSLFCRVCGFSIPSFHVDNFSIKMKEMTDHQIHAFNSHSVSEILTSDFLQLLENKWDNIMNVPQSEM